MSLLVAFEVVMLKEDCSEVRTCKGEGLSLQMQLIDRELEG